MFSPWINQKYDYLYHTQPDDELTKEELVERKRKEKQAKARAAEKKLADDEARKAENAAYRA